MFSKEYENKLEKKKKNLVQSCESDELTDFHQLHGRNMIVISCIKIQIMVVNV